MFGTGHTREETINFVLLSSSKLAPVAVNQTNFCRFARISERVFGKIAIEIPSTLPASSRRNGFGLREGGEGGKIKCSNVSGDPLLPMFRCRSNALLLYLCMAEGEGKLWQNQTEYK